MEKISLIDYVVVIVLIKLIFELFHHEMYLCFSYKAYYFVIIIIISRIMKGTIPSKSLGTYLPVH